MNKRAWLCSLFLAVIWTFGLMLSSSPLLSLHSTCCVASPPTPKLRAWRGENSCRHICRENTTARHPRVESLGHRIWRCSWVISHTVHTIRRRKVGDLCLPQTGAWAEQESLLQTGLQVLCLCCQTQNGCAIREEKEKINLVFIKY